MFAHDNGGGDIHTKTTTTTYNIMCNIPQRRPTFTECASQSCVRFMHIIYLLQHTLAQDRTLYVLNMGAYCTI